MMREVLERIMCKYFQPKPRTISKEHPMFTCLQDEVPRIFQNAVLGRDIVYGRYVVEGSAGKGMWAINPWIAIFDERITTTAQKGVYIVYLFERDGNSVYLTLNQGCTELLKSNTKDLTIKIMQQNASKIKSEIRADGFFTGEIDLGRRLGNLGKYYEKGTIFYKKYKRVDLPQEEELRNDLKKMLSIYNEYYEKIYRRNEI